MPAALRARAQAQNDAGTLDRLTETMSAWAGGAGLSIADFADRFPRRAVDDPVAHAPHSAALTVDLATSHTEPR